MFAGQSVGRLGGAKEETVSANVQRSGVLHTYLFGLECPST